MLPNTAMACLVDRVRPVLAALLALGSCLASLGADLPADVTLRAALIYRFTTLAEFPASSFTNEDASVRVIVFGPETVADPLRKAVEGKKAWGRSIAVTKTTSIEEATNAHVIVVGSVPSSTAEALLKSMREKPVLTIGGSDFFCSKGGMLNLVRQEQRFGFEVNADAVKRAGEKGLHLNPIIYKLGKTVRE